MKNILKTTLMLACIIFMTACSEGEGEPEITPYFRIEGDKTMVPAEGATRTYNISSNMYWEVDTEIIANASGKTYDCKNNRWMN